ncbi:hypothetical protein K1718_13355 [Roseibium porphyridii]|uniref:Uncharacterized protein n=1 Tax=Roseibium porphyridii TaxID=2866279 RepID=A0ABY8FA24_9HYPH|nr:hypothetical protein [Roseibium sp. KMA01]WFE92306.1 hypothetical protein K1718_13355 [Roseibium sp. KMA01]
MDFKVTDIYRFWWPVLVRMPDPDHAGSIIEQKFEALFEALNDDRAAELDEAFEALETDKQRKAHQHDVIRTVMKDWRGVLTEDDSKQPFSSDVLDLCLKQNWFRIGVYEAYAQAMRAEAAGEGPTVKN